MRYLSIDIGGTYTKYAVMSAQGKFLEKGKLPTVKTGLSDFLDSLKDLIVGFQEVIDGIAISSAGVIDSSVGIMRNGGSLDFIKNFAIVEELEKIYHIPVSIENDAKCAAFAELRQGSLSDCQTAVSMIIGTSVGGAVIIDRKIIKGKHLLAGEFSYILTDASDSLNGQKNLAIAGGVPSLIRQVEKVKNCATDTLTGEDIFDLANSGDKEVLYTLRTYAHLIATQIINLHFTINPDRFAIGGGISEQELFLEFVREEVDKLISNYPFEVATPDIRACHYNNDANLLGALYNHLEK